MTLKEKLKARADKLVSDTAALYLAFKRKETPVLAKVIIGLAVGYALSPIDLIPDFIPVLGYLDDVLILPFLVAVAIKLVPKDVLAECRVEAEGMWQDGKPKSFWFALPIIAIWLLILFFIIKAIWF